MLWNSSKSHLRQAPMHQQLGRHEYDECEAISTTDGTVLQCKILSRGKFKRLPSQTSVSLRQQGTEDGKEASTPHFATDAAAGSSDSGVTVVSSPEVVDPYEEKWEKKVGSSGFLRSIPAARSGCSVVVMTVGGCTSSLMKIVSAASVSPISLAFWVGRANRIRVFPTRSTKNRVSSLLQASKREMIRQRRTYPNTIFCCRSLSFSSV